MAVKAKELAKTLGISPASVSLVLNHKPGVSDMTREKVMLAVKELGCEYMLPEPSRKLHDLLFLVYRKNGIGKETSPYFSQIFADIIEGVESQAKLYGYKLNIAYVDSESLEEEVKNIEAEQIAGILVLATEMFDEQIKLFSHFKVPAVIIDDYMEDEDIDCVVINNEQGVSLAVSYLVSMGHRNIGYLHVDGNANNFQERYYGFKRSIEEHKLMVPEENIIKFSTSGGDAVYYELQCRLSKLQKMPTAFFADNDIIAISAIRVLREMSYKVPEDISIVGFDNIAVAEFMDPPLTTVSTSKHAIGSRAVRALHGKINYDSEGVQKIEIKSKLIERKSVKKINDH